MYNSYHVKTENVCSYTTFDKFPFFDCSSSKLYGFFKCFIFKVIADAGCIYTSISWKIRHFFPVKIFNIFTTFIKIKNIFEIFMK